LKEQVELQKWLHEQNTQIAQRAHDRSNAFARQINDAAINGANLALRMALLINGGAAITLLTFVGDLPAEQKRAVAATLDWFAWGVAAAMAALAFAYFTNHGLAVQERSKTWTDKPPYLVDGPNTKRWRKLVLLFRCLAIGVGIGSLVLFIVGMLSIRAVLTKLT
jgi:Trk-type K+ transport system membrane component